MLQVTSTLHIQDGGMAEALAAAQAHVERSRREDGCIRHEVFQSPNDPNVLFFYERWRDRAALDVHFRRPESIEFVQAIAELVSTPPQLEICEISEETSVPIG